VGPRAGLVAVEKRIISVPIGNQILLAACLNNSLILKKEATDSFETSVY
jgi:hypothetical protein